MPVLAFVSPNGHPAGLFPPLPNCVPPSLGLHCGPRPPHPRVMRLARTPPLFPLACPLSLCLHLLPPCSGSPRLRCRLSAVLRRPPAGLGSFPAALPTLDQVPPEALTGTPPRRPLLD
eukprot:EG_transcript_29413